MIRYQNITGALLLLIIMASCVRDGADPCPVGTLKLNLFVEKFRNVSEDPLNDKEENFYSRVNHLQYYLYKDGEFVEKMSIPLTTGTNSHYPITLKELPYGDYEIAFVANSTKNALTGDNKVCDNLVLQYQGSENTEDYFTWIETFTVDSEDEKQKDVGLLRTQGVVRYKFYNMPPFINKFKVSLDNVHYEKRIKGDYEKTGEMAQAFTKASIVDEDEFLSVAFPTPRKEASKGYIYLYEDGNEDTPYFTVQVNDTIVKRNHMINIESTFNNGNIDVEVSLDTEWNGTVPGGIGVVD